jgi:hypothetical protein
LNNRLLKSCSQAKLSSSICLLTFHARLLERSPPQVVLSSKNPHNKTPAHAEHRHQQTTQNDPPRKENEDGRKGRWRGGKNVGNRRKEDDDGPTMVATTSWPANQPTWQNMKAKVPSPRATCPTLWKNKLSASIWPCPQAK